MRHKRAIGNRHQAVFPIFVALLLGLYPEITNAKGPERFQAFNDAPESIRGRLEEPLRIVKEHLGVDVDKFELFVYLGRINAVRIQWTLPGVAGNKPGSSGFHGKTTHSYWASRMSPERAKKRIEDEKRKHDTAETNSIRNQKFLWEALAVQSGAAAVEAAIPLVPKNYHGVARQGIAGAREVVNQYEEEKARRAAGEKLPGLLLTPRERILKRGSRPVSFYWSETFALGDEAGHVLHFAHATPLPQTIRAVWACGSYAVEFGTSITHPVLEPGKQPLGPHKTVPFFDQRLEKAAIVRTILAEATGSMLGCGIEDGYWAWKKAFEKLLEKNKNTLAWTIADLEMFSGAIDAKYGEWMHSLALEMRSFCLPKKDEQAAWDDLSWFTKYKKGVTERVVGGRQEVVRFSKDLGIHETREVDNYLGEPRESLSDEALAALRATRRKLREEINGFRAIQEQEITKAIEAMTELLESTREQAKKSGDHRPHLKGAVQYWEDQVRVLPAQLYMTARRLDGIRREMAKLDLGEENATEELRLLWGAQVDQLEAALRERQQPVASICDPATGPKGLSAADRLRARALFKARAVLELIPNVAAAEVAKTLDIHFLDLIGKKQTQSRKLTSDAFHEYLRQRGYDPAIPSTWSEWAREVAYTSWATGLAGNILFYSKPGEMSDRASKVAMEVAENHVSLLAIRSLRKNGMPFPEIRSITGNKLKQHVRLRFANGRKLPQAKADRIANGIRKLLADARLADLQALASDDKSEQRFVAAFATEHYPGTTEVNTWPEWFLDISSARNVALLFGPSAVVRVGGRWALWSPRWGNYYKVWEKGAAWRGGVAARDTTAISLREAVLGTPSWILSSPRLQPLMERLSGGRLEAVYKSATTALSDLIIRDQIAYHNMGKLRKGLQYGGALVGATMVYGGAFQIAEDQNWPWLRTMVEVLAILSAEEVLVDVFRRNVIATRLLKANLNKAERLLQMERLRLASYQQRLQAVSPGAGTVRIDASDLALTGPHVPGVDGYKGFLYAEKRAKELSSKAGRTPVEQQEYQDVLRDMERFINRLDDGIKDMDGKITRARAGMGEYDNPVHPDLGEPKAPKKPEDVPNPEKFEPDTGYWEKGYPLTGAPFKEGDELLKKGKLAEAEQAYQQANAAPGPRTVDQTVYIERRLSLVERVKRAWRKIVKRRKRGRSPAEAPIDIAKVRQRLGPEGDLELDLSRIGLPKDEHSVNPVLFLKNKKTGKPEYAFKILRRDADNADELVNDAFMSALLADDILKQTGIRTPAAKIAELEIPVFQYANDAGHLFTYGGRLEEGLLTRYVPGVDVNKLPIEEVLALKEAYARHGVLRAWLGDYDRHLGNMRLGDDGYPYLLDVGLAIFDNFSGTTTEQTLRFLINFRDRRPSPAGNWIRAMDDRIHIDTMKPVIEAIQELSSPQHEDRLRALVQQHFKDPAKANKVFHQLKTRSSLLEKGFRERFKNVAEKTQREMEAWFRALLSGSLEPL